MLIRLHYAMVKSEGGKFRVYQQGEVVDFPSAEAMHMIARNKATAAPANATPLTNHHDMPDSPHRTASKALEEPSPDVNTPPVKRGRPKKQTE